MTKQKELIKKIGEKILAKVGCKNCDIEPIEFTNGNEVNCEITTLALLDVNDTSEVCVRVREDGYVSWEDAYSLTNDTLSEILQALEN